LERKARSQFGLVLFDEHCYKLKSKDKIFICGDQAQVLVVRVQIKKLDGVANGDHEHE